MPIVKGPLFSLRAAGTLGRALVYATNTGRNVVRRHLVPSDPHTPGQLAHRAQVAAAATSWHDIGDTARADWQAAAAPLLMNGYAYFIQQWFAQESSALYPPTIP